MHEIYLVRNILKTLEDEFPGEIEKVRGIHLTAGLLSNVQPIQMQNAFDAVLEDEPRYNKTTLHVKYAVLIHWDECDKTTEVKYCKFVCIQAILPSKDEDGFYFIYCRQNQRYDHPRWL